MANYDYCLIGSATDVGRVRKANEDRCAWFDTDNGRIGVVCDGMGGHVGGQIASQTAIDAIKEYLNTHIIESPQEAISNSITYANQAILQRASTQPELTGMGSTCVMLLIRDGRVYYGHVGDSRIYIISSRIIRQLTKDHSFVQMLVDAGQITAEQAEHHPRKNEITNALGLPNMQPPTVCIEPIEPDAGTAFLLCSDGLTGMVNDRTIEKVVSNRSVARLDDRAGELVHLANDAGGVDNISVLLVEFALGTSDILSGDAPKSNKKKLSIVAIVVSCVFILLSIGGWYGYKHVYTKNGTKQVVDSIPEIKEASNGVVIQYPKSNTIETIDIDEEILFEKNKIDVPIVLPTGISLLYKIDQTMVDIQYPYNELIRCIGVNVEKNEIIIKRIKAFESLPPLIIHVDLDSVKFRIRYKVKLSAPEEQDGGDGNTTVSSGSKIDQSLGKIVGANIGGKARTVTENSNNTKSEPKVIECKYNIDYHPDSTITLNIKEEIDGITVDQKFSQYISVVEVRATDEGATIKLKWSTNQCAAPQIKASFSSKDTYNFIFTVNYPKEEELDGETIGDKNCNATSGDDSDGAIISEDTIGGLQKV